MQNLLTRFGIAVVILGVWAALAVAATVPCNPMMGTCTPFLPLPVQKEPQVGFPLPEVPASEPTPEPELPQNHNGLPDGFWFDLDRRVSETVRMSTKGTIDEWVEEKVAQPIEATESLFGILVLRTPYVWHPTQRWVLGGWGGGLLVGILLVMFALMNHARHMVKGTDLASGRHPLLRLGPPVWCLILMLCVPVLWEALHGLQEHLWAATDLDRSSSSAVLGVVLAPIDMVPVFGSPVADGIRSISASFGVPISSVSGIAIFVIGLLSFVIYLFGRMLIISAPIYLGLTAFSHDLAPTIGWTDLAIRTNLTLSLFNLAWLLMQHLPNWMSWLAVDHYFFILFVLPSLLWVLYKFWAVRAGRVLLDPLTLGGGQTMTTVGNYADKLGKVMAVAGTLTGQPEITVAGRTVSGWGRKAHERGEQYAQAARQGKSMEAFGHSIKQQIDTWGARQADNAASKNLCWRDGTKFVTLQAGVPVWHDTQPKGTHLAGDYQPGGGG